MIRFIDYIKEDVPVNNAGSGAINGIGAGEYPKSEPGVNKKKKLSTLLNSHIQKRTYSK